MPLSRTLITGGAGFIGSHLTERLLGDGHRVVVLDSFDPFYDPEIKRRNLAEAASHPSFRLVEGDIRDSALLDEVLGQESITTVVHLAARAGVRPSIEEPAVYASVNVDGTTRLLEACRRHGVSRFLFGSSSSVYGNNDKVPFAEDDPVDHPISPYAATKKAGELIAHVYHRLFGIDIACLRFFTVYGPRQRPEMAIHKFARLMADGEQIEQYGAGETARDFTFVTDIVEGIVRSALRRTGYRIWNLGGSSPVSLAELIELLGRQLDVRPKIRRLPRQPGDVERTWADVERSRRELDWSATVGLEAGIRAFLDWFEAQRTGSGRDR